MSEKSMAVDRSREVGEAAAKRSWKAPSYERLPINLTRFTAGPGTDGGCGCAGCACTGTPTSCACACACMSSGS